jgi:methanogen homocitrate synthase
MAVRSISYAKSKGVKVTFICVEASRSERPFLERLLVSVSKNSLPDSVALYDTAGCLIPASAALMVKLVKEVTGLPVEVHYHNDLGLGLANTLAAIEAGAEIVHVTVNGLGERGGNVSLDELAIALHCLYGMETKIDYPRLTEISKLVERLSEIPLSRSKPIVSDGVYCRESGPGSGLVKKAPLAIFSLAPSAVGQTSRAVLGKMSGLESVDTKLEELGIEAPLDREQKKTLLGMIKSQALEKKGIIDDNEFREMIAKVLDRADVNL